MSTYAHTWRVPFICHYAVYVFISPEDGCSEVNGEIIVHADSMEEAIQKAECRLSHLGFNRILIDPKLVDELYSL